ncbi:hypothetical protein NFJ02_32g81930 [Pycnococcus provasolii]
MAATSSSELPPSTPKYVIERLKVTPSSGGCSLWRRAQAVLFHYTPFVYPYGRGRHGDFDELSADEERTMLPQWTAVIVLRVSAGGNSAIIPIVFGGQSLVRRATTTRRWELRSRA